MLDTTLAASIISSFGVGINGPGQVAGASTSPPGNAASGARSGFASSGQTVSPAVTAALSTATTTFLQAPGIAQAPVDGQSADNDPARQRESPIVAFVEALTDAGEENGGETATPNDGDAQGNGGQSGEAPQIREAGGSTNEAGPDGLTEPERQVVQKLQQTDIAVRQHEQAHAAVGGPFAGSPRFQFVPGPDGRQYAVSGQVSIDSSPVPGNPQATVQKLRVVQRAALAPTDPSAQDQQVASAAQRGVIEARRQLSQERTQERAVAAAESGANNPVVEAAPGQNEDTSTRVTDEGISAAAVSQALLQASTLSFQRPPSQTFTLSSGGVTGPVIDPGTLFNLTA